MSTNLLILKINWWLQPQQTLLELSRIFHVEFLLEELKWLQHLCQFDGFAGIHRDLIHILVLVDHGGDGAARVLESLFPWILLLMNAQMDHRCPPLEPGKYEILSEYALKDMPTDEEVLIGAIVRDQDYNPLLCYTHKASYYPEGN
uniref:Uncharacterized protein n=1 Tax=Lutzomyia longipalpis TaxID=7200 RepID=A0A1B0CML4_LUTLO